MDSMRSLNTSLPIPPPPPEQLLQAFKNAALSVTNLYKAAAADQSQIRHNGYQEAISDLLTFLDKENLGLGDGEGWAVRQWATERFDGLGGKGSSDSDDDREDTEKETRASSPAASRQPTRTMETWQQRQQTRNGSPAQVQTQHAEVQEVSQPSVQARQVSAEPVPAPASSTITAPPTSAFTFTSAQQLPPHPASDDTDMQGDDRATSEPSSDASEPQLPSVRVESHPRASRANRHGVVSWHSTRNSTKDSTHTSTNSKRKFQLNDFFDFSNLGNGKDQFGGGGGGKRSRFT